MHGDTDAVAEAVAEVVAVARVRDYRPRDAVYLRTGHAGCGVLFRGLLRGQDKVVDLAELRTRFA